MSEESENKVVSRDMIKTLTLGSGEKIIAYIKGVSELGSYITERPFTIHIDDSVFPVEFINVIFIVLIGVIHGVNSLLYGHFPVSCTIRRMYLIPLFPIHC